MSNLMSQKQNAPHMTHHEIVRRLYLGFEPASPKLTYINPENAEQIINQTCIFWICVDYFRACGFEPHVRSSNNFLVCHMGSILFLRH